MPETAAETAFAAAAILDAWDETPSLRAIRLDLGGERAARYATPGQVLKLRSGGGESYFALASGPRAGGAGHAEILIKRGAPLADALIADALKGAHVAASDPFGRGFPVDGARGHDLMLFAAGSGIAPVRALVQHVIAARAEFGRVELYYGQRAAGEFAYAREHAEWERAGVRVVLCASRPDGDWSGERGHVQDVARTTRLGAATIAFVCGMKGMIAGV